MVTAFYVVPYSVAATPYTRAATGHLRILADTADQALGYARAIHAARALRVTTAPTWAGPGRKASGPSSSPAGLSKRERDAITYGTPVRHDVGLEDRDLLGAEARAEVASRRIRAGRQLLEHVA